MRRFFALLVLLVLVGVGLYYWKYRPAGQSPQQALGSVGEKLRGARTTGEVKRALAANVSLAPYDIQVRDEGGRVVLRGQVKTAAEKDLAGALARDAAG